MMDEFEMKDLGLMHYFLGLEVYQCNDEIFVCQSKYAKDMLLKFGMESCKPLPTPIAHGELLCKDDGGVRVNVTTYRSIVGSLMFLTNTRPKIAFATSLVSRYMGDPFESHMKAAKRILRYVQGIIDLGIHYIKHGSVKLVGYSDSDWGSNIDDRKSTFEQCFNLDSGMITCNSKKQSMMAHSSIEAEYIAITSASAQALWLRKILEELCEIQSGATILYCDNKSAIQLAQNPVHHNRSKHFDMKYHFIRDMVEKKIMELRHISTLDNVANIFTKAIINAQFLKLKNILVSPFSIKGENVGVSNLEGYNI